MNTNALPLNSNAIHNFLNVAISVVSVLGLVDWTTVGVAPATALKIVGVLGIVKLVMNATRDGFKGMVEPQPPVKQ